MLKTGRTEYSPYINYVCKVKCKRDSHICKSAYYCSKHTNNFNCNLCGIRSRHIAYLYQCRFCMQLYCIHHFIMHNSLIQLTSSLLYHFCNSNTPLPINSEYFSKISSKIARKIGMHIINSSCKLNLYYFNQLIKNTSLFMVCAYFKKIGNLLI